MSYMKIYSSKFNVHNSIPINFESIIDYILNPHTK